MQPRHRQGHIPVVLHWQGTQPKTVVQQQMKPIIKTDPDVSATMREVQSEDEEPYMEDEFGGFGEPPH